MFRLVLITLLLLFLVARSAEQQDDLVRTISSGGDKVTVDLKPFSIRSPNFGVLVQNDTGSFLSYDNIPPSRTYLGSVRDHPGAMATALLNVNGTLLCRISFENGVEWSSTGGEASVRGTTGWNSNPQWPTSLVPASKSDAVLFVAEVGVDATYLYYLSTGSSVENTVNMAEFSILSANMPFLRDASILHTIGKVVIRASQSQDPYENPKTGVLLDRVEKQWRGAIASVVGNTHKLCLVAHPRANGGLAWVATAAKPVGYSAISATANGDFTVIWRHEAGHNWGSSHYEGGGRPEGPTIMSDNQLSRFSSSELAKILRYKSGVPRLASNITVARPPRANMDAIDIPQNCTCCSCFKSLDVLANDLDADVKSLTIALVQSPSALGSATSISNSSRNQITYTPSLAAGLFLDHLKYTIQNSLLRSSTGYVTLRPASLLGWWKMDETSGSKVQDSSGHAANGELKGGSWNNGNGLSFGGAGTVSLGASPSIRGKTSFSIALWIYVTSTSEQVIIQQRSPPSSITSGSDGGYQLSLFEGKPRFWVCSDSGDQFRFSASAAINDGGWHHIVAVRDQAEGQIYIDGKLSASASGDIKYLDVTIPVFMGADARDNTSFLTGSLMGAKIYSRALEQEEIRYLSTWPEALVAWWKLDDKSGVSAKDSSWNGATGSIEGSTTWNPDGGLTFDGAGKVALGTKPSLSGKTSFSIHAWVKVPPSAGKISRAIIIQQRSPQSSTTNGFNGEYLLYLVHGKPHFFVYGNSATQFDFSASSAINDGEWHHIVAVRDNGVGQIYIDGELSASKSGTVVRSLDASIPVFLGWDSRSGNSFFTGSLKGVKIYNQAVAPNFEAERTGICPQFLMLFASAKTPCNLLVRMYGSEDSTESEVQAMQSSSVKIRLEGFCNELVSEICYSSKSGFSSWSHWTFDEISIVIHCLNELFYLLIEITKAAFGADKSSQQKP
ncbi:hypothetical protein SELMODRAFT_448687 [Selaginella moellendorffii]|uniref:Laminin G domain-containing protein n=1 Tax=Selaginella moellendorffii TaxID=88036 RepID=D8T9D2_SELML|nr:hypothetical protein SELMODRAFT_448687 [Selaginella moellendorffii]